MNKKVLIYILFWMLVWVFLENSMSRPVHMLDQHQHSQTGVFSSAHTGSADVSGCEKKKKKRAQEEHALT